jgi:putative NADPH-quinone reductase
MQAFNAAGQEVYKNQPPDTDQDLEETPPDEGDTGSDTSSAAEDVVEADYEIVDEEK